MRRLNVLELFAGIGGLGLGLERAGMTVVGQVEIDTYCQRVLAKHWPEVPRHDDVRTCLAWWHSRPRPPVDLIAGGFPCQTVSVAGRRRGQTDHRWLWPDMAHIVRVLRPRYVLVENVPGLLAPIAVRDDSGRVLGYGRAPFEDVLGDLAACGYDAAWDCLPAAAVGAPHRRDRVFIVAHAISKPVRVESLAQSGCGDQAVARDDGAVRALADTAGIRRNPWRPGHSAQGPRGRNLDRGRLGSYPMADPDRDRQQQPGRLLTESWRRPRHCSWWATEPAVGRVADGVPARVDRLRSLGNAVVPHVAEHVGRLILAHAHSNEQEAVA